MNAFLSVVKKVYPAIHGLSSLGGPFGVMAANMVGNALGVDGSKIDPTPDGIANAIAAAKSTPEQLAALKQVEADAELKGKELGFANAQEMQRLADQEMASARDREVQMAKAGARDWTPMVLAFVVTIGFFITLWVVFVHGVRPEMHDLALGMVTTLGTAWVGVIGYYFGSSKGSDDKTKLLGDIARS